MMGFMSEEPDRFRGALARAAKWKIGSAILAGAGLTVGFFQDTYLGYQEGAPPAAVCGQSAVLGVAIAIVFLWSLRCLGELREDDAPLTAMAAHRLWGRAAGGDAVGLLPWGVLVCASFHRFGARPPYWAIAVVTGLAGCLAVHLLLLPRRLFRALTGWQPTEPESTHGASASDPVRKALGRVAAWRVGGALLGLCSLGLPWVYGEALANLGPHSDPESASRSGTISGLGLLADKGSQFATVFAWLLLSGVLVMLCVSWWELRRARWPVAIRLLRARVLGAWVLSLVPCIPALVLWLGALVMFAQARPFLAGAWMSLLGLALCAAWTVLATPLLLRRAAAERADECAHD